MVKKVVGYGVVGLLAVALVAGMVYVLLRPAEAQAGQGPLGGQGQGRVAEAQAGTGYRGGGAVEPGGGGNGRGQAAQGQGAGGNGGGAYGRGQGSGRSGARGATVGTGDGVGLENPADTWVAVSGTVVAFDDDLIVRTTEGDVEVGTGPEWYWDANGIALNAGDEVVLRGFYEGDEFEIGAIENATTGESLEMRDETGRPLWAGRGRQGN